jgi:hypothetical protein
MPYYNSHTHATQLGEKAIVRLAKTEGQGLNSKNNLSDNVFIF